jgi:hypothetical protein
MNMTDNSLNSPTTSPKPASKTVPGIVLRLILVLIAGCLVGAVIYFAAAGWVPYLDQRVFQPIDTNQAKVLELQATQGALEEQISALQDALQTDINKNIPATLTGVEQMLVQLSEEMDALRSAVESNTYYAATLGPARQATVSAQIDLNSKYLSAIATAQMGDSGNREEIELLRILNLLTWAHQYIQHDNYGLAEDQLESARDQLSEMVTRVPPNQRVIVLEMLDLVQESLADLPARPSIAAEKLQLAWQMGVSEFPKEALFSLDQTITPTPSRTPSSTPSPTPN